MSNGDSFPPDIDPERLWEDARTQDEKITILAGWQREMYARMSKAISERQDGERKLHLKQKAAEEAIVALRETNSTEHGSIVVSIEASAMAIRSLKAEFRDGLGKVLDAVDGLKKHMAEEMGALEGRVISEFARKDRQDSHQEISIGEVKTQASEAQRKAEEAAKKASEAQQQIVKVEGKVQAVEMVKKWGPAIGIKTVELTVLTFLAWLAKHLGGLRGRIQPD